MVTHDFPPYAVVGGVPARVIRQLEVQNPSYALDFHRYLNDGHILVLTKM